ncbi:protein CURVATURE THYLAKOID 1D, chloroplastic isoform X1 [Typha latifolia]|uniref:protein CURVATURE THYLAKOID 1D, chloroplastic isoform X1 n=1 Tax=Typha latifolia TaxID=4733 RepID=UPI003C2CD0A4
MELSTTMLRAFPSLPRRPLVSDSSFALAFRPTLPTSFAKPLTSRSKQGFGFAGGHWLRASASDETSTAVSEKYGAAKNDEAPTKIEVVSYGGFAEQESSAGGEESEVGNPLNQLDLKLDSKDTYMILIYGSAALVALWISSALVSSLDSLPVFPKVMEVVGLGFTVWFISRYLIFKNNRDELFAKIDELKEQTLGSGDD